MKNLLCYFILFTSVFFVSCKNESAWSTNDRKKEASKDSKFEVITMREGCDDSNNENCVDIRISYPSYEHENKSLHQSIMDYIHYYISDFLVTEKPVNNNELKPFISQSVEAIKIETLQKPKGEGIYKLDFSFSETFANDSLVTLKNKWTWDQGGAHPNSGAGFVMFTKPTGKIISLHEIIKHKKNFKQFLLEKIKQEYGTNPAEDLENMGFLISDKEFAVSDNLGITANEFMITYSPYEIAPYAMGFINVTFLKEEVTPFLQPSFVEKWNSNQK